MLRGREVKDKHSKKRHVLMFATITLNAGPSIQGGFSPNQA